VSTNIHNMNQVMRIKKRNRYRKVNQL